MMMFDLLKQSFTHGNGIDFRCQHGADECSGNKIHSCGLNLAQSEAAKVEFVTCQMSYGSEGSDLVNPNFSFLVIY